MKLYESYKKVLYLFIICGGFTLVSTSLHAQVSGTISDASGEPLIGVNVAVPSTDIGTITEIDGSFIIDAKQGDILEISYVGYQTIQHTITNTNGVSITLSEESALLDEVVVVGYGAVKKDDLTGVVTKVNEKDFIQGSITSPEKLLNGKVAGLQISGNGEPGGASRLRLRGTTSLTAESSPLIVVDGVPLDSRSFQSSRNPLAFINAADVESMTVLKDASATAIYGSRGANGVIIITTKSGKTGKPRISYSGNANLSVLGGSFGNLSPNNFRAAINARAPQEIEFLGDVNTDWTDEVLQLARSTEHNLSVSGGFDNFKYYLSGGYLLRNGVLNTSSSDKTTFSAKLSTTAFGVLDVSYQAKFGLTNDVFTPNVIGAALAFDPSRPVLDADSQFGGYFQWRDPLATANPVATIALNDNTGRTIRSLNNLTLTLRVPGVEGLSVTSNSSYDQTNGTKTDINSPLDKGNFERGGRLFDEELRNFSILQETYATYKRELGNGIKLEVTGGHSWQEFDQENRWEEGNGLVPGETLAEFVATQDIRQDSFLVTNRLISFFGRVNLDLKNKYLVTLNFRQDGSSRFGPQNRWGYFPGVAVAWRPLQEEFLSGLSNTFSDLKIRGSWGVTGNEDITDFLFNTFYSFGTADASYQFGDTFQQTLRGTGVDPGIKWEETTSINMGIDFGFYNNRVSGSLDLYSKRTDDLLSSVAAPAFTNLSDIIVTNIGEMENRGVEFALNTVVADTKEFDWNIGFNVAYNQNTILKLDNASDEVLEEFQGYQVGGISGDIGQTIQILRVGESIETFYTFNHLLDANGRPLVDTEDHNEDGFIDSRDIYEDVNGDGLINESDLTVGPSALPDFIFGFTSNVQWRKWDASVTLRANTGNFVYNNNASSTGYFDRLTDRVTNNIHQSAFQLNIKNRQLRSNYYIEDASFLKLDNLSIGYNIRGKGILENMRVFLTGSNLLVLTGYSGQDPEIPQFSGGIDNNVYPASRNFLVGLSTSF